MCHILPYEKYPLFYINMTVILYKRYALAFHKGKNT